jgi:hypothetical protein
LPLGHPHATYRAYGRAACQRWASPAEGKGRLKVYGDRTLCCPLSSTVRQAVGMDQRAASCGSFRPFLVSRGNGWTPLELSFPQAFQPVQLEGGCRRPARGSARSAWSLPLQPIIGPDPVSGLKRNVEACNSLPSHSCGDGLRRDSKVRGGEGEDERERGVMVRDFAEQGC